MRFSDLLLHMWSRWISVIAMCIISFCTKIDANQFIYKDNYCFLGKRTSFIFSSSLLVCLYANAFELGKNWLYSTLKPLYDMVGKTSIRGVNEISTRVSLENQSYQYSNNESGSIKCYKKYVVKFVKFYCWMFLCRWRKFTITLAIQLVIYGQHFT